MQIRFILPLSKTTGAGFKNSLSAVLSGLTVTGAFSTLIFNSTIAKEQTNKAIDSISSIFQSSFLYGGIKKVGETFKDWGITVVSAKDDLKDWLYRYLGPEGFKSGVVELYEKLSDWALIVYTWFKDKFIEFIKNIPSMVENWKKLRFTLFKWGTFLGGGGGAALWAMFGSFENFGKLADLMGNESVREAAEMFAELVDKNPKAFENMNQEEMQDILERIAEEPEDAKEIMEELKKEQEKMAEAAKKEEIEEAQLDQDSIKEAFKQSKGSPQNEEQVFGHLTGKVLNELSTLQSSFLGEFKSETVEAKADKAIEEYIKEIESKKEQKTKTAKAYKAFLEALGQDKDEFKKGLKELARKAFWKARVNENNREISSLKKAFEEVIEKDLTEAIPEGGDKSEAVDLSKMIILPKSK